MKKLKQYYFIPFLIALLLSIILIRFFFPPELFSAALITVLLPLIVLGLGFWIITYQRIKIIRGQLYQILQTLEEFDMDEPGNVSFEKSPSPMFNELNEYLVELVSRVRKNFRANKQFTQNASHELQTPLAVIKGHVEILLQSPNIGEKEIKSLALVLQNTNRLSKLNSALILLSKIEHQRFPDSEYVSFSEITEEVFHNFKDLLDIQGLELKRNIQGDFQVEMSKTLAEILVANLVQNAIRYNLSGGYIEVSMASDLFMITNPGKDLKADPMTLFNRFKRESNIEESLGLGLSIVKRICDQHTLKLSYTNPKGFHTIKIEK